MSAVRTEELDGFARKEPNLWGEAPRKRTIVVPEVHPPATLDELLADTTFMDYGRLRQYKEYAEQGLEPFAYHAVKLVQTIQKRNHLELSPTDQASLVIRYVVTKATPDGLNYYSNAYGGDHMARDLALGGYGDKDGIRAKAWGKLLRAERLQAEAAARRRQIRRIPIDAPSPDSPLPLALIAQSAPISSPARR